MEDRKGYKKTKLGWIPVEWDVVKFEEVMVLQRGYDLPIKNRKNGEFPLIASNGIIDSHNEYKVKRPGIITGRSGTLGKVHFIDNNYWPLNTTLYTKEIYNNDPKYLYYFLQSFKIERFGTGTGVPTLNRNNVHIKYIIRPRIPEQKKIASILTTVDNKIESINNQIEQTEQLKKGLSQELLTKGIGHTEFKDSKIGRIPVEWDVVKLNDLGTFKNGINKSKEDFGSGHKFVNLMDVFGKSKVYSQQFGLVQATEKELQDFNLIKGDILFVRSSVKPSGVGLTSLVVEDLYSTIFSGFLIRFRGTNNYIDFKFKKYCFHERDFRHRLLNKSTVSANTNINQDSLKSLHICIPPLPEQKKIATILSAVDDKIEILQSKKSEHETLKKGLMEQLLTGQIRVQV